MCFRRCPCGKKLLSNTKMLVQPVLLHNFLHNHMRHIYRQIHNLKGKKFCLNKIRGGVLFPFFLFFKQTVVQTKFCLLTQQMRHRHGCGLEKPFWADSARSGSFHALRSAWSVHHTSFGVTTELIPWSFAL